MKKNNKKGFTLVELVIVVAVMAILVAIAIPTVGSVTQKAQTAVNESNANTIESMIKLAAADAANKAADGKVTIDAALIKTALTDAKLGIESGSYVYDSTTGSVSVGTTAKANQFLITFDSTETDLVTVTAGK